MTDQDIYIGTILGIAEMINNGVTAVADHYFKWIDFRFSSPYNFLKKGFRESD